MPSVAQQRYGAPSLNQVLDLVTTALQQKQRISEQQVPQSAPTAAPQTAMQGLLSGLLSRNIEQRRQARAQEDQYMSQALAMLNAIPDDEQNTPLKLQLAAAMLNTKPGKKNAFQELFDPQADHTMQARLLEQITSRLPGDDGLSPAEKQIRQQQITQGPGAELTAAVNQKYAEQNKGKFNFPDEGKYSQGPVIQTADGLMQVLYDLQTGQAKLQPLGNGQTEKIRIAEIKAQGGAGNDTTRRKEQALARTLAARDGIDLDKVGADDPIAETYLMLARQHLDKFNQAQLASTQLNVPYKEAKTNEALANARRGGITGGQAATIQRQDRQDQTKARAEISEAQAELQKAQSMMDTIWNNWRVMYGKGKGGAVTPDDQLEQLATAMGDDNANAFRQAKAQRDAAKVKLQGAQERLKGLGTPGRLDAGGGMPGRGQVLDLGAIQRGEAPIGDGEYTQHDYYLDDVKFPASSAPMRSAAKDYGDPEMFYINASRFNLQPGMVRKGQTIVLPDRGKNAVFLVLGTSSDGATVLVRRKTPSNLR